LDTGEAAEECTEVGAKSILGHLKRLLMLTKCVRISTATGLYQNATGAYQVTGRGEISRNFVTLT